MQKQQGAVPCCFFQPPVIFVQWAPCHFSSTLSFSEPQPYYHNENCSEIAEKC